MLITCASPHTYLDTHTHSFFFFLFSLFFVELSLSHTLLTKSLSHSYNTMVGVVRAPVYMVLFKSLNPSSANFCGVGWLIESETPPTS